MMYLPLINGAAEGCFSIGLVYLFTAYVGKLFNKLWKKKKKAYIKYNRN